MPPSHALVTILPCSDLGAAEASFAWLAFVPSGFYDGNYRMLADGFETSIHLRRAEAGWVHAGQNPLRLYFYTQNVDALAEEFRSEIIEKNGPEHKPWGMYEFAVNGPMVC